MSKKENKIIVESPSKYNTKELGCNPFSNEVDPDKDVTLTFNITQKIKNDLVILSKQEGISVSSMIKILLIGLLERDDRILHFFYMKKREFGLYDAGRDLRRYGGERKIAKKYRKTAYGLSDEEIRQLFDIIEEDLTEF